MVKGERNAKTGRPGNPVTKPVGDIRAGPGTGGVGGGHAPDIMPDVIPGIIKI